MVNSRDFIQAAIFSLVILAISILFFTMKIGMSPAINSIRFFAFEVFFYGLVFYIFRPKSSLLQLFAGAGLTFLYRVIMGMAFGLWVWFFYSTGSLAAMLKLGVYAYLPAVILYIVVSPFIMRPFFSGIMASTEPKKRPYRAYREAVAEKKERATEDVPQEMEQPYLPKSQEKPATEQRSKDVDEMHKRPAPKAKHESRMYTEPTVVPTSDAGANGYDRAVSYLSEHHAVMLAVVVDHEGLTLASWRKADYDPEEWAPMARLIRESNRSALKRNENDPKVTSLDMIYGNNRLSIINADKFDLLVLSNHEEDELLRIRIVQAADIIRKYSSERYGNLLSSATEERYVSDTRRTE